MYNHSLIEKKWRKFWEENKTNKFIDDSSKEKYFALVEFPYPSGAALHMGHGITYTANDIVARYKLARGFNVLSPIGWDAFGLPAEQYAIKNNKDPNIFTQHNIDVMREQLKELGLYVDYTKEIDTTDPQYYAITQWIFAKLFENGLAVLKDAEVNWCEELGTVLANDEIIIKDGKMFSERGEYPVIKKPMKQWILKITDYAEQLSNSLNLENWPSGITQKQWIGVSHGTMVNFNTDNGATLTVYTTRVDTIFGVTFIAIAPENKIVNKLTTDENRTAVEKYIELTNSETEIERKENKNKTGVFTGSYAINPVNNKKIPIYISDYVINSYATGMVMGVPAHDQRDYEFAKKFNIDIIPVIDGDISEHAFEEDGVHINSGFMNGLKKQEAMQKGLEHIIKDNIGTKFTTTKLHDWTFSRQRYWGEPFPIIYDEKNIPQLVSFSDLPVVLPKFDDYNFEKKGTYVNPLENAESWKKININGKEFRRETDTMPGSAGSSWYWIAYVLKNPDGTYEKIDSAEGQRRIKRWLPVDTYIGGKEHTTGHVLYARFWNMFLFNIGMVNTPEFFTTRIDHGLILAEDGRKMSKRWGNVINPTDIIESHGADALRTYCAFIGPIDGTYPWKSSSVDGIRKWLDRVYNLFTSAIEIVNDESKISKELNVAFNIFVKNITKNMDDRKHNIAISDMMVYINECYKNKILLKNHLEGFLVILGCFAPFLAEELNEQILKNNFSISKGSWPKYEESLTQSNVVNLPVQVDGKLRATILIELNTSKEEIIKQALANENVFKYITNGYQNIIYVPNKILSIISKK